MDIQQQVAARRAQREREQEAVTAAEMQAAAELESQKEEQKQDALAAIAEESGLTVEGGKLALPKQPLPPIDVAGLKQSEIDALLKGEARKRWSPGENWMVIGSIVGGACLLIPFGWWGLAPLLFGLWNRWDANQTYRDKVKADYPDIFK